MSRARKATRNAVGKELTETQVQAELARIQGSAQRITRAATLHTIERYYQADDIEITSMKASLMCPISKTRVKVPVRTLNCRHVECFDLSSYLNYHRRLTFWECPISFCKVQAKCGGLFVDEYMSEVLQTTDDRVQEVLLFADGSFKTVQRSTATATVTIDDEQPYVPDNGAEPIVKTEPPMNAAVFPTDEGQPQAPSPAAVGEEQLREALRESRQQNAALRGELDTEKKRADKAESDASKLRDEIARLREELTTKTQEILEFTAENQEQQTRLDAVPTAAEATERAGNEPVESESWSMDQDLHDSSSLLAIGDAGDDATEAATDTGPSTQRQLQLKHDARSASDAPVPLLDHVVAPATKSDRDGKQEPRNAPKQRTKNFTCVECGRVFYWRSRLNEHQRTHTGVRPFKCAQCGRTFTQSGHLLTHARVHTGEKPYKCAHCSKAFSRDFGRRMHERVHTGVKPYKCAQCGGMFVQSSHLRTHERRRHPVTCPSEEATKTAAQSSSQSEA